MKKKIIALAMLFLIIGFVTYAIAETHEISEAAIKNNNVLEVERAIKNGADVNAKHDTPYGKNTTALMFAAKYNSLDVAKLLIKKGADVNAIDEGGNTSLAWAASFSSLEVARLLIDMGVDVNAKNSGDVTALLIVTKSPTLKNSVEVVKLLLEKGADVNVKDKYGDTAIKNVVDCPHENCRQMVTLLKQYGAVEPEPKEPAPDGIYQIEGAKIKFFPPLGWKRFREDSKIFIDFRPTNITDVKLYIAILSPAEESDFVTHIKSDKENSKKDKFIQILTQEETVFLSSKAYITVRLYKEIQKQKTITFYKNNKIFIIMFVAKTSDYDNLLSLVQKSLETLQIE